MKFMAWLKKLREDNMGKLTGLSKRQRRTASTLMQGDRLLTDEHELLQHTDGLGSTASDGLNRLV